MSIFVYYDAQIKIMQNILCFHRIEISMDVSLGISGKTYKISKEIDKMDRLVLTSSEILEKLELISLFPCWG